MNAVVSKTRTSPIRMAAVAICAVAWSTIAAAQQTPPVSSQNRYAIPGCHVMFVLRTATTPVLRTATLAIDVAWLEYGAMADFVVSNNHELSRVCPTQPVEINNVWLSSTVLDVLKIKDLGHRGHHPYWNLDITAGPAFKNEPQTFPPPANRAPGQPVETTITMQKSGRGRTYDIEYLSPDVTMAGRARISCADDAVNRTCGRWGYPPFAGLMVDYKISQDQFPAPNEVSTDPNTEPGALLQFDQRLREWLIDLERPR